MESANLGLHCSFSRDYDNIALSFYVYVYPGFSQSTHSIYFGLLGALDLKALGREAWVLRPLVGWRWVGKVGPGCYNFPKGSNVPIWY